MIRELALTAALFAGLAPLAFAQKEYETSPPPNPAQPAVGAWIGGVSWNNPIVQYGWTIYPDGTFTSGRTGRGQNGGGAWGTHGAHLTLKYSEGFRYEGELKVRTFHGVAYTAKNRAFGSFSMSRADKYVDTTSDGAN